MIRGSNASGRGLACLAWAFGGFGFNVPMRNGSKGTTRNGRFSDTVTGAPVTAGCTFFSHSVMAHGAGGNGPKSTKKLSTTCQRGKGLGIPALELIKRADVLCVLDILTGANYVHSLLLVAVCNAQQISIV